MDGQLVSRVLLSSCSADPSIPATRHLSPKEIHRGKRVSLPPPMPSTTVWPSLRPTCPPPAFCCRQEPGRRGQTPRHFNTSLPSYPTLLHQVIIFKLETVNLYSSLPEHCTVDRRNKLEWGGISGFFRLLQWSLSELIQPRSFLKILRANNMLIVTLRYNSSTSLANDCAASRSQNNPFPISHSSYLED